MICPKQISHTASSSTHIPMLGSNYQQLTFDDSSAMSGVERDDGLVLTRTGSPCIREDDEGNTLPNIDPMFVSAEICDCFEYH